MSDAPAPMYEAVDPRSDAPDVELVPLAARLDALDGKRIAIVQTMPPGSGLEDVVADVAAVISSASLTAVVTPYLRTNFMMHDQAEVEQVASQFDAAVIVSGPAATMVHLAFVFATALEAKSIPTAMVYFEPLAVTVEHALTTVGAPIRSCPRSNASQVIDDLLRPLTDSETAMGVRSAAKRPRIATRGTLDEIIEFFETRGWTDGLPIVPPTEAAVRAMLRGTTRDANDVVTETFRPEGRRVTVEMVAITAAMAGAKPEYLPVILAAASVFGDLQFESMTRSVNSFAFAQLVSGPVATQIGMNGGLGALGPGNRANATIGRAVNLLFRTVGGSRSGVNATPTQGSAVAYTAAFCENTAESPWTPFRTDLGFDQNTSTVSVLLGGWAHNGNFYYGDLDDVIRALMSFEIPQTGAFVFVSSKRAHELASQGWTKQATEQHLQERATIRLGDFRASGFWPMSSSQIAGQGPSTAPVWPKTYLELHDDEVVPGYPPGSIKVVVVGSDVSSLIQVWKWQLHRTVSIDEWR